VARDASGINTTAVPSSGHPHVEGCPILFDVDLASGSHAPFLNSFVFGIEFSPKGQYLYVTTYDDGNLLVPTGFASSSNSTC